MNLGMAEAIAKLIVRRGKRPEYYGFLSVTAVANGDAPRKWIDEDVIVVR